MLQNNCPNQDCPVAPATLRQQMHEQVDRLADFCESCDGRFFAFVKQLQEHVCKPSSNPFWA